MKFLKVKKNKIPSPQSLRRPIFNIEKFWFAGLGICFLALLVNGFISFKLMYNQYFEGYKETPVFSDDEDLINIKRLESVIKIRSDFINQKLSIPRDPSYKSE